MLTLRSLIIVAALLLPLRALADDAVKMGTLYKDPDCGCCEDYADYLRQNGYQMTVIPTRELPQLRAHQDIPEDLAGCHMTLIDGYAVEGHVPVQMINRLLSGRPDIKGISLPGMPLGAPGMSGEKSTPFTVLEISGNQSDVTPRVFGVE